MNWQFYEFWGKFLLQFAHGQKQSEDIQKWMQQGLKNLEEFADLFQRLYGQKDPLTGENTDSPQRQQVAIDFHQMFAELAGPWGWVTRTEHQKALDRCAELEKTVIEQQAKINQLRDLLTKEGLGHSELFTHFQDSLQEQTRQFNILMNKMSGTADDES